MSTEAQTPTHEQAQQYLHGRYYVPPFIQKMAEAGMEPRNEEELHLMLAMAQELAKHASTQTSPFLKRAFAELTGTVEPPDAIFRKLAEAAFDVNTAVAASVMASQAPAA